MSARGGEALVRTLVAEEALRPFDLERGPVWRAMLLRLGAEDHVLTVTMHHIASDGWSTGILLSEFVELYTAWQEKRAASLPELGVQYADFAVWQRERLQGEVLERQLSYWKEQLQELTPLELPVDRMRPATASHRGATYRFSLEAETEAGIRELSRREGVTLFMTLLAAFNVLLARYSGQWDIAVGSPIANRNRLETERLIGFFVNTLVLRVRMKAEENFRQLLARVREVTLGAYERQDVPFEKLVEELAPQRNMSSTPLFQVVFILQNAPRESRSIPGLKVQSWQSRNETAKFDLTLTFSEGSTGLVGALEYATDLFDAATIQRMAGHYRNLLESLLHEPDARVRELNLLTNMERKILLSRSTTKS
jgi:hypothetical protein